MAVITTSGGYILYHYIPSVPGAVIVASLFAIGTLAVLWRSISTRTKFAIPFLIGGLFEVIGYIGRAIAKTKQDSPLIPFILQSVFLLVAPALFAATIYMTLGRVIRSVHGERFSVIRPTWITRVFVLGDVISFFAQSAGAGLQASKTFNKKTAQNIILGGLGIQILAFGFFVVISMMWHLRMRRASAAGSSTNPTNRWQHIMFMLYATSILILVRSVFRVIEYAMGTDGYLLRKEWPLYLFDAVLMLATVAIFAWKYPGYLAADFAGKDYPTGNDLALSDRP